MPAPFRVVIAAADLVVHLLDRHPADREATYELRGDRLPGGVDDGLEWAWLLDVRQTRLDPDALWSDFRRVFVLTEFCDPLVLILLCVPKIWR